MMRVVDTLPGKEEIAKAGLVEKDFRIDPGAYRHFVEQCQHDFNAFKNTLPGNARTAEETMEPGRTVGAVVLSDEDCIEAFDRSRPPFYYHQGSIYRYRIDRAGPTDRPIVLDSLERSEITGSLLGIPFTSQRQGLLMWLCLWIEKRLQKRDELKRINRS